MPILADNTELRQGTRLPPAVAAQCTELPGLEMVTGADLLITVGKVPPDVRCLKGLSAADLGDSPGETVQRCGLSLPEALIAHTFKKACESGLLAQRKTGYDLASSVPEYSRILAKMLRWTSRPWLTFIGDLKADRNGMAIIDGNRDLKGFSYNAVQGALEAWQDSGGRITFLSHDSLVAPWIARQLDKLRTPKTEKILPPRRITRPIIGPESNVKPWRITLMTFPNMGLKRANLIAENNETLIGCLEQMASFDWLKKESLTRPRGIGVPTAREWRQQWMGLHEDFLQLLVVAVPPGTVPKVVFIEKEEENVTI